VAAPNTSSTPEAASRFALQGVLGNGESGSALISVDGKPAKPVRVGAIVVDGWFLRQASGRRALLAEGHTVVELTLPTPPAPNTTPASVAGNSSKKSP
jgi:general secretion pathway protein C